MTPAPQPQKEYIITEEQLVEYALLYAGSHSADMDSLGKVHTRAKAFEQSIMSSPAPSHLSPDDRGWDQGFADGQASALADCNICSEKIRKTEKQRVYGLINSDEIAIRNAERERWGKAIDKWCEENDCRKGNHEGYWWTPIPFPSSSLLMLLESLRTKEHP